MGFPVYDFRNPEHVKNLLVLPEMRSRILKMEPGGGFNERHSHDLGIEVFLILQGHAEFEIEGEMETLGPGQLCFALVDQAHAVRVVGDEPVIMYLSVTPHILPTHTGRTKEGEAKPVQFSSPASYDVEVDKTLSRADRIERHRRAVHTFHDSARSLTEAHQEGVDALAASSEQDEALRNKMWEKLFRVHRDLSELSDSWNDLAPTLQSK